MTHRLTITDLSGDRRDTDTLLFRTPEGARGYAARRGDYFGMRRYALDGRDIAPNAAATPLAEEPVGYVLNGQECLYGERVA